MGMICAVVFQRQGRLYYADPGSLTPSVGDHVLYPTEDGAEVAEVVWAPQWVSEDVGGLPELAGLAGSVDLDRAEISRKKRAAARVASRKLIREHDHTAEYAVSRVIRRHVKTLESIEDSRLPKGTDWEVLIVDNNSTDTTSAVCQSFLRRNPERYRYLFEKRQGKSFALNAAVENATGEIIAFTDDDVLVGVDWLFALLIALDEYDCVGVAGRIVPVWNSPKPVWFTVDGPHRLMLAINLGPHR